jgi:hypothetical protein
MIAELLRTPAGELLRIPLLGSSVNSPPVLERSRPAWGQEEGRDVAGYWPY